MYFQIYDLLYNFFPKEIVEKILFFSRPIISNVMKKELYLEKAHLMCKINYNWWYLNLIKYWSIYDIEHMIELPIEYNYDYAFISYFSKEELNFIIKNLFNCNCCKKNSQGILNKSSSKNRLSLQEINNICYFENNIKYNIKINLNEKVNCYRNKCNCSCRHILTAISSIYKYEFV